MCASTAMCRVRRRQLSFSGPLEPHLASGSAYLSNKKQRYLATLKKEEEKVNELGQTKKYKESENFNRKHSYF